MWEETHLQRKKNMKKSKINKGDEDDESLHYFSDVVGMWAFPISRPRFIY